MPKCPSPRLAAPCWKGCAPSPPLVPLRCSNGVPAVAARLSPVPRKSPVASRRRRPRPPIRRDFTIFPAILRILPYAGGPQFIAGERRSKRGNRSQRSATRPISASPAPTLPSSPFRNWQRLRYGIRVISTLPLRLEALRRAIRVTLRRVVAVASREGRTHTEAQRDSSTEVLHIRTKRNGLPSLSNPFLRARAACPRWAIPQAGRLRPRNQRGQKYLPCRGTFCAATKNDDSPAWRARLRPRRREESAMGAAANRDPVVENHAPFFLDIC